MNLSSNANTRWMSIFVDELARNGLESVCIAPGSRSTPLALAFANQPDIHIYRHLDERSAGYFALGLAKATQKPVALVCTSGTATANFHPAVIEAYYAHIPLLVLTADRPPELRGSGANQTIDQIKMFGDHVRWSVEVPTPEAGDPEIALRHLRTLAARAYATAVGLIAGPVHLNFPFRKPLEPEARTDGTSGIQGKSFERQTQAYSRINRGHIMPDAHQIEQVANTVTAHRRGLIICGPDCPGGEFPSAVAALADYCGYLILADPLSNIRHGWHVVNGIVLGGYNLWLPSAAESIPHPDVIIRFGSVPTSAALAAYLEHTLPIVHIHIRESGEWADDLHFTNQLIQANEASFCAHLIEQLIVKDYQADYEWVQAFRMLEKHTWEQMDAALADTPFFDGVAVRRILEIMPEGGILFAGNSMPIRHIDTFDRPSTRAMTAYGNRGASGIDGNVSTALGIAAATNQKVMAIMGDITFYHDMNGLLAVRQHDLNNITFIVINNDGGGIFHRLPVARHEPPFSELFLTPHGLRFEHAAALYGLCYDAVSDRAGLETALMVDSTGNGNARLIEVQTNSYSDFQIMRDLTAAVTARLKTTRV